MNYALTGETECAKWDFRRIEIRRVINSAYKISVTSRFHKEIDSFRSMIPITGEVLTRAHPVEFEASRTRRCEYRNSNPKPRSRRRSPRTSELRPSGVPPRKFRAHCAKVLVTRSLLERKSDLCLGIAWFISRVIKVRSLSKVTHVRKTAFGSRCLLIYILLLFT